MSPLHTAAPIWGGANYWYWGQSLLGNSLYGVHGSQVWHVFSGLSVRSQLLRAAAASHLRSLVLNRNDIYEATGRRNDERGERFNSRCERNCMIGLFGSAIMMKVLRL